jgi:hypothetical protein
MHTLVHLEVYQPSVYGIASVHLKVYQHLSEGVTESVSAFDRGDIAGVDAHRGQSLVNG